MSNRWTIFLLFIITCSLFWKLHEAEGKVVSECKQTIPVVVAEPIGKVVCTQDMSWRRVLSAAEYVEGMDTTLESIQEHYINIDRESAAGIVEYRRSDLRKAAKMLREELRKSSEWREHEVDRLK